MDAAKLKEILRLEYGIHNMTEFEEAVRKSEGINIGIFTMPFERRKEDELRISNY